MLDINDLDYSGHAILHLRHPETGDLLYFGDEQPVTVTLAGTDSSEFQKATLAERQAQINAVGKTFTPDNYERTRLRVIARCVIDWRGIGWQGKEIKPDFETVFSALSKRKWLREQIEDFIGQRANFSKASPQA
jgi:hypothetical protein